MDIFRTTVSWATHRQMAPLASLSHACLALKCQLIQALYTLLAAATTLVGVLATDA